MKTFLILVFLLTNPTHILTLRMPSMEKCLEEAKRYNEMRSRSGLGGPSFKFDAVCVQEGSEATGTVKIGDGDTIISTDDVIRIKGKGTYTNL